MSKSKPSSRQDTLLAALKQQAPSIGRADEPDSAIPPESTIRADAELQPIMVKKAAAVSAAAKSRAGKPVQFWIHEEDRRRLRELAAWLAGQGERPTDSMVIRSALRITQTGSEFLKAYRDASQLDGRLKQRRQF